LKNTFCIFIIGLLCHAASAQALYFPPNGTDTWESMSPAEMQWCDSTIAELYDYLDTNQSKAFILLKDGKIVLEQYFNGHDANTSWYWASAGKTLTAMLVGIAQQEGSLQISDPTSQYIGSGWTSCTAEQEQAITIRNQLTMTTGLQDAVADPYCTLDTCLIYAADAGTRWAYHNAPYTLLDSVLEAATGQTLNAYCYQKVLQPSGMQGLFLPVDYNNVFFSNARTMARYGLLLLAQGNWNGTSVLNDSEYFDEMTHSSQSINEAYGYLTWLNGTNTFMLPETQFVFPGMYAPSAPSDMFAAIGRDGQFICAAPSQNLVWIRMGENPDQLDVPLQMAEDVWQRINALPCAPSHVIEGTQPRPTFFPNPASNELHWNAASAITHVNITSSTGQPVLDVSTSGAGSVDLSQLSPGIYVCRWSNTHHASGYTTFVKE
jgi:CubicO group peptidase (beta-lactamase class C family)